MTNPNRSNTLLSTLGLLLITVWSAVQYLFYANVPEDVPTFAFLCITNVCGCLILALTQFTHLKKIQKQTILKGISLSFVQLLMNFFVVLGSRNMDAVIISSVMSLYFIFVTPILLLMKKRVSFRSGVATVVALIALLLVFNANLQSLFKSINVIYLFVADIFFAGYIVLVSNFAGDEDPQALSVAQMASCAVLSLIAWFVEAKFIGHSSMSLPSDANFWISVLFIGIFIRALYSVIQFSCQKNLPPINASLIFASEIVITLILNPLLCKLFHTPYEPANIFQIVGCVLFVIAVLICDDDFMRKFHYSDMDTTTVLDEDGNPVQQVPLSRKIVNMNLLVGLGTLVVSIIVCLVSVSTIRNTVIDTSRKFGTKASESSGEALLDEVKNNLVQKTGDKSAIATARFQGYQAAVQYGADLSSEIMSSPDSFAKKPVLFPYKENAGIWAMQMVVADESIPYEAIQEENEALGNLESFFASIHKMNSHLTSVYIGTEKGLMISYDPNSGNTEESGAPIYYEYRDSGWYTTAKASGQIGFTDTYMDGTGRGLTITCYAPIIAHDGAFLGAIGMDFLQQDMNKQLVNDGIVEPEKAFLISPQGVVIAASGETSDNVYSIRSDPYKLPSHYLPLFDSAYAILNRSNGIQKIDGHYVSFSTIEATGWKLCITSPEEMIIAPAIAIRKNIDTNTEIISETVSDGIRIIIDCCLIFFAVIVLLITYFVGKVTAKITDPLKHLEQDVLEISQGNFNQRTTVDTQDEIGSLARAFNGMTSSLQHYISDLTEATAREERISSELSLATQIQADALPTQYPAFPEHNEFDLAFTMKPAKEVGGDFYDFFMIDDSHLGITIADVSGKGVPAALFMMISKIFIKNRTMVGGSPSEILSFVNNQLCENNKVEMFVTAWLGILDLKTGELIAANAGHEYPVIKHKNGQFELFKDRHGFILAGMEDSRYRDYTLQLIPGDTLFLYTDGVPEASDANYELFGTDRMLNALNQAGSEDCVQVIQSVMNGINTFVGTAPQFDDITMLCLRLDRLMQTD